MSELRADILREVERAIEDFQPIDVTVDAIMALINASTDGKGPVETAQGIHVGDNYTGEEPADCDASSPQGFFCCRPRGHTGRHVASNGDKAIAVWRG